MHEHRPMPTTQALRDQHSSFAEELGGLAAGLASLDSGHAPLRKRALGAVERFVEVMGERLVHHCADEDILASLFPDVVTTGVEAVRRPLAEDRSRLPFALQDLADATAAAVRGEAGAEARVVSLGYAFGQAVHCHVCREERGLLDIVDRELGTGTRDTTDANRPACHGSRC